ncbi:MAG: hypothetical protein RR366_05520, partial [Clostridium sp.]
MGKFSGGPQKPTGIQKQQYNRQRNIIAEVAVYITGTNRWKWYRINRKTIGGQQALHIKQV